MRSIRIALPLLLLALPASAADAAVITGGQVDWGVKQSFRNYVMGPIAAPGSITPSEGATQTPAAGIPGSGQGGGPFRFPITGGDEPVPTLASVATRGRVRFSGHAGQLDFTIFNVRVVLDPPSANSPCLIADADAKRLNGGGATQSFRDVRFAKLNTTGVAPVTAGANTTWSGIPATLTTEGSPAFAGFYQPGTALDPVSFSYTKGAGAGSASGSCERAGTVTTVPPGGTPPASKVAGPSVKFGMPSRSQRRLLARGKAVDTRVRVSQAGRVALVAGGRIAGRTRTAGRVARRATKPGVVTLRWKLGKGARRELAAKRKLALRVTVTLPKASPVTRRFTLRAPGGS